VKTFLFLFITGWLCVFYPLHAQYPKFPFQNIYHYNGKGTVLLSGDEVFHATITGVRVFDTAGNFKRSYDHTNVLPESKISSIYIDSREHLWVGTRDKGLAKYDGSGWEYFDTSNVLSDMGIRGIMEMPNGDIWFGTEKSGICIWNGESWGYFTSEDFAISDERTWEFQVDELDNIWVYTYQHGFYVYDGQSWEYHNKSEEYSGLPSNNFDAFHAAKDSSVWACFSILENNKYHYDTLGRYKNGQWEYLTDTLLGFKIEEILEDSHGNIYFMGKAEGVKYDGQQFTTYDYNGLEHVYGAHMQNDSTIWYLTSRELIKTSKGAANKHFYYGCPSAISGVEHSYMHKKLYVGSRIFGLGIFDGFQWKNLRYYNSPIDDQVSAIALDNDDRLWAGTSQGIYILEDDSAISFIPLDTIHANVEKIKHIFIDSTDTIVSTDKDVYKKSGNDWENIPVKGASQCIKGPGDTLYFDMIGGVKKYHGGTVTDLTPESDTIIYKYGIPYIAIGPDGHLWAGSTKGIARYKNGTWEHFHEDNSPLADNYTLAIASDKNGTLWVFNDKKINLVSSSMVWDSIAYDTINMVGIKVYDAHFQGNGVFVNCSDGLRYSFYKNYVPEMVVKDMTIEEELENMTFVGPVVADSNLFTSYNVTMEGKHAHYFSVENNGLHAVQPIDYETFGQDTLHLSFHLGHDEGSLDANIVVTILNINDNAPDIQGTDFQQDYPFLPDTLLLGTLTATDADNIPGPLLFSIGKDTITGMFSLNESTGEFFIINKDSTVADTHFVPVTVFDGLLSGTAVIKVVINDTTTASGQGNDTNLIIPRVEKGLVKVFPNPARQIVRARLNGNYEYLTLTDLQGHVVLREKIVGNQVEIDVSKFPKGGYILKFYNTRATMEKKLMIQ